MHVVFMLAFKIVMMVIVTMPIAIIIAMIIAIIIMMMFIMMILILQISKPFDRHFLLSSRPQKARRRAKGGRGRGAPEQDTQRVSSRSAAAYPPEGYKSSSAMAALSVPAILAEKTRARPTMPPS